MMKRQLPPPVEELAEKGYKIVSTTIDKGHCQAPLSWCSHCDLCEHGSHYVLLQEETDKARRKELRRTRKIATACLLFCLACIILLTDSFRPYVGNLGAVILAVLLMAGCIGGLYQSVKGIYLTNNL